MAVSALPVSSTIFDRAREAGEPIVTELPKFDLDIYLENYQGKTRALRAYYIGTHSTFLALESLKLAVQYAQTGEDVSLYQNAVEKLGQLTTSSPAVQEAAERVRKMTAANASKARLLEEQLKTYKNNLIKDSIRNGNQELGKHYHATGELELSYEAFSRMRQDLTTQKQLVDIAKHSLLVAIEQRNWNNVLTNVQKIQLTKGTTPEEDLALAPYQTVPAGLALLAKRDYLGAAKSFVSASSGITSICYSEIVSPNDIAVYGGLCALATFERHELEPRVLSSSTFRTHLELEPHIRKAISSFISGRYRPCLDLLDAYRTDYLLDIYLANHVKWLYNRIRHRCIRQFFAPFTCVTFAHLETVFGSANDDVALMDEIIELIRTGTLDARIDMEAGTVVAVRHDEREELQAEALKNALAYEKKLHLEIFRMNIVAAGLEIKGENKNGKSGRGGGTMNNTDMGLSRGFNASSLSSRLETLVGRGGTCTGGGGASGVSSGPGSDSGYD